MAKPKIFNALSVDVEDYYHVAAFDGAIDRKDWPQIQSRVVANTHKVLDCFSQHEVKATFFVLGLVAEKNPELVRAIVESGHELASHGYSHKKIYLQTQDEFRQETRRAKKLLEDISGQSVEGYRAASFSITDKSMWALDELAEAGFNYDSSIFPVHHDNYGVPGAQLDPHVLTTPAGYKICELPLSSVGVRGLRVPVGGGGYFRLYPYWLTHKLLQRMNDLGRSFVFYCHPWEFDPQQPRIGNASRLSKFRHYNNLEKFEPRMRKLISDFQLRTCSEVLALSNLGGAVNGSVAHPLGT